MRKSWNSGYLFWFNLFECWASSYRLIGIPPPQRDDRGGSPHWRACLYQRDLVSKLHVRSRKLPTGKGVLGSGLKSPAAAALFLLLPPLFFLVRAAQGPVEDNPALTQPISSLPNPGREQKKKFRLQQLSIVYKENQNYRGSFWPSFLLGQLLISLGWKRKRLHEGLVSGAWKRRKNKPPRCR